MGFSRQEYWSGLSVPSPEDLPNPGINPRCPALQADSLPSELQGCLGDSKTGERFQLLRYHPLHTPKGSWALWRHLSAYISICGRSFLCESEGVRRAIRVAAQGTRLTALEAGCSQLLTGLIVLVNLGQGEGVCAEELPQRVFSCAFPETGSDQPIFHYPVSQAPIWQCLESSLLIGGWASFRPAWLEPLIGIPGSVVWPGWQGHLAHSLTALCRREHLFGLSPSSLCLQEGS